VVRRGSRLIDAQRQQLTDKVSEITAIASQNGRLHERVRGAALRTAALNERFLRRIAADLHDGPGQDMALALMRFNTIKSTEGQCTLCGAGLGYTLENCNAVYTALQSALTDLRAISLGLQLPEIEPLQSTEIAERSVRDFENKTNARIALTTTGESVDIPLPVKIALYRLIQESLANGFRHGGSTLQRVSVAQHGDQLAITVSDNGAGFEQGAGTATAGHLGLTGMRERVEILGGSFNLQSAPGQGTVIEASLPLQLTGIEYE